MESKKIFLVHQISGDEYEPEDTLLYITDSKEEADRFKKEWDENTVYNEKNNVMTMEEYENLEYGMDVNDDGEEVCVDKGGYTVEDFNKMSEQFELYMSGNAPCYIEVAYMNEPYYKWNDGTERKN